MLAPRLALASSLALVLALLSGEAGANGNVSHQWISRTAATRVPAAGSLHALVNDPALRQALFTGTMFPDWGYTPGATVDEREAGEASHWEPVQDAYRRWITDNYAPPWSDEARLHLAFYLGMTSHGIADQSYDAMFFERSEFYENKDHDKFDGDSDVLWVGATGPGEVPTPWVPTTPLIDLFATVVGAPVEVGSMTQQLNLIGLAIYAVSTGGSDPELVAKAAANFPWAAAHHQDSATPGNPPHEAEIARRYWQSNWALLHGDPLPRPVLWTFPADGGAEHAVEGASIESWVTIVFARALDQQALVGSQFHVVDSMQIEAPIELSLFYGNGSHVVHLKPSSGLIDDEIYRVTVDPGVKTIHGESLAGWSFTFSTGLVAPPPVQDDGFWDMADGYGDDDGSSSSSGGASASSSDGSGSSGEVVTGADSQDGTGATSPATDAGGPTSAGAVPDATDAGCGCQSSGTTSDAAIAASLLALTPIVGRRRRSRRRTGPRRG